MVALPDFANTALFPSFHDIPDDNSAPQIQAQATQYFLLAQVRNNMTITKPTLTLTDRTHTTEFALVYDGLGRDDLDFARLGVGSGSGNSTKPTVAVIPNAVRTGKEGAKQGFVRIAAGDAASVGFVPGRLERVLEVGGWEGKGDACQVKDWTEGGHNADCKMLKALANVFHDYGHVQPSPAVN
ncbi:hypothetical protein BD289DRAFT_483302 [Coniella lustricola]|uniref:Uncharacterized protein n=1 Tax=Coniella lustricola TaxID=2025994 RepID=A0A2T3A628_9PEZI|nr:hypothetical protein BD289DRAFT_483302 [Coniella lustricola]